MGREVHAKTKAVYEDPRIVEEYFQAYVKTMDRELASGFVNSLSAGRQILDLGCGPGHYTGLLSELGAQMTGLDYSSTMIAKAKEVAPAATFVVGDMFELDSIFAENTFDGIWANASLFHMEADEIDKVLTGMKRIIKTDGKVYIRVKEGVFGTKVVEENVYGQTIEREFLFWDEKHLSEALTRNGFVTDRLERQRKTYSHREGEIDWLRVWATAKK